jgi:hypothetical protein
LRPDADNAVFAAAGVRRRLPIRQREPQAQLSAKRFAQFRFPQIFRDGKHSFGWHLVNIVFQARRHLMEKVNFIVTVNRRPADAARAASR